MTYRTDLPSYSAAHRRVRSERGPATMQRCVDCGGSADEWSYDHADSDSLQEVVNGRLVAYSRDPEHYDPRCRGCHLRFDLPVRPARGLVIGKACGTYAGVQLHRKAGTEPCLRCREARNEYMREYRRRKADR